MSNRKPKPRWMRNPHYTTPTDERKILILDVLRRSLIPLTRREITAALNWPDSILLGKSNGSVNPLVLLKDEGKVGVIREGNRYRYFADPDIGDLLTNPHI